MKYFVTALLTSLLFFNTARAADTGVWFNPDRNGEGINIITNDDTLVFFFYTYRDSIHSVPPVVSPAPPDVPQVGPNLPVWYIGQADNFDGESAEGILYAAEAFDFPFVVEFELGTVNEVATFELVRDGEGWLLEVKYRWNYLVPWYVSLYNVHSFTAPLITK